MNRVLFALLVAVLIVAMCFDSRAHLSTYQETRQMLARLGDPVLDSERYAMAFRMGFNRVDDLIRALNDDDAIVRLKAQVVLRYIADPRGLVALDPARLGNKDIQTTGPVPAPVTEMDYKLCANLYLTDKPNIWRLTETQIALVIDGSPRARAMLDALKSKGLGTDVDRFAVARTPFEARDDVSDAVLRNSLIIPQSDRHLVTAKLLALSPSKEKALVSLYINRGVLAEEWWHVVVARQGDRWRFVSITMIGNS